MVVGGDSEIMVDCGWSWVVGMKLWLVVGGGGELMPGCGWSWVVAAKLWLVVDGRGWLHDLVMPIRYIYFFFLLSNTTHSW